MKLFPKKLNKKLEERKSNDAFRSLGVTTNLVDFSSNDYLGLAKAEVIFDKTHQFLLDRNIKQNGATGSRLLSGNHKLYNEVETMLATFHESETALVFNSGYDANVGFFATVPQRGDIILYDELIHASIRDGIQLSNAKAYKFKHNDVASLDEMLKRVQHDNSEVYVVTESVFSMDGDTPDVTKMAKVCKKYNAYFVVDEAHAVGVFGAGIIQQLKLQNEVFARVVTFGKALGCHGATILGSSQLKEYLVNFARSFIYTTGLSPHSLATIINVYNVISNTIENKSSLFEDNERSSEKSTETKLHENINHFKKEINRLGFAIFPFGEMSEGQRGFIESNSAIHCCTISGNEKTKNIAQKLQEKGFDVKPILSPTVPQGQERLRFCLHSYNSTKEITEVLENLVTFV